MKIINLHNPQKSLIKEAIENNREAQQQQQQQQQLFEQHLPKMLGVCRQYVKDLQLYDLIYL